MKNYPHAVRTIPEILVVDDMQANLRVLVTILENEGYKVRPVTNGQLALLVAEKEKPDLILLDIMMPGMDGFEVCRLLKEKPAFAEIPVIFISALTDTSNIVKAFSGGGVDYITKPFQVEEVTARVRTHLKLHQQKIELQEQKKEMQKLNSEKDKFFSIISHDLRSPFNGLLGLSRMLVAELPYLSTEEIIPIAVGLRNSATKVYELLDDLLEWVKIQRGVITFDPTLEELLPLAEQSIALFQETVKSKNISITADIPAGLKVYSDSRMLKTILRNLISNALKFTPPRGEIKISATVSPGRNVRISILDSGIGMKKEMITNLFRLDVNTTRKGTSEEPGTGLGLIISKELIEKHGGKLNIESVVGKGSLFWFTLPCI